MNKKSLNTSINLKMTMMILYSMKTLILAKVTKMRDVMLAALKIVERILMSMSIKESDLILEIVMIAKCLEEASK